MSAENKWMVLLIHEDDHIINITKKATKDINVEGRKIELIVLNSLEEAKELIGTKEISLLLMEINNNNIKESFEFLKHVRKELENDKISINIHDQTHDSKIIFEFLQGEGINAYIQTGELSEDQVLYLITSGLNYFKKSCALESNIYILKSMFAGISYVDSLNSVREFLQRNLDKMLAAFKKINFPIDVDVYYRNKLYQSTRRVPPNIDGFEYLNQLNVAIKNEQIVWLKDSVILMFCKEQNIFARIEFHLPLFNGLKQVLSLYFKEIIVSINNLIMRKEAEESLLQSVWILTDLIESRSEETGDHVRRVMDYTEEISKVMGIEKDNTYIFKTASMMHDIGKIGVPDKILNKPAKLTPEEFEVMKKHSEIGYTILRNFKKPLFEAAARIAHYHHENWDGSGYPTGLKGREIPIEARIVSLSDYYDALGSDRVYRKAWEEKRILDSIKELKGIKFDPKVVDAFFKNYHKILAIKMRFFHRGKIITNYVKHHHRSQNAN